MQAIAPTIGLEESKAALRQVFGETLLDEFVDVMLTQLVSVLRPGPLDVLDEATLNTAIALIASVQPRSELEAVIALQIAATAFAGLKFLHLSQRHRDGVCVEVWGGFATRLLRLELELTETLDSSLPAQPKGRARHLPWWALCSSLDFIVLQRVTS